MTRYSAAILCLMLAACGGNDTSDIEQFVAEANKTVRGHVEPIPEVKPYQTFAYQAFDLPDPFKPRKLQPKSADGGGGIKPDLNRPKEALENYPLESLKMVGTLQRDGATYAIVKTPDNNIYRVKTGNYMGQNYGIITGVAENEIKLTEIVQDSAGDWTERVSSINLQE